VPLASNLVGPKNQGAGQYGDDASGVKGLFFIKRMRGLAVPRAGLANRGEVEQGGVEHSEAVGERISHNVGFLSVVGD
jgi:hypothetical protein